MKHTQMLWAATALLFVATAAQAQRRQDDHHDRQDQRGSVSPPVQRGPREATADAARRTLNGGNSTKPVPDRRAPRRWRISGETTRPLSTSASNSATSRCSSASSCNSANRWPSSSEHGGSKSGIGSYKHSGARR